MQFYSGGYYLVQASPVQGWMDKTQLPELIYSISPCVCNIYPGSWAFPWWDVKDEKRRAKEVLNLTAEDFLTLEKWIAALDAEKRFGWPNVFTDLETVKEFYAVYLTKVDKGDIKIIGIGLSECDAAIFLDEERPAKNVAMPGIYRNILNSVPMDISGKYLGFEILGDEGGRFHSFLCNNLETGYKKDLAITLNECGLISKYEDACRATAYSVRDDVGAESLFYQPWLLRDYTKE